MGSAADEHQLPVEVGESMRGNEPHETPVIAYQISRRVRRRAPNGRRSRLAEDPRAPLPLFPQPSAGLTMPTRQLSSEPYPPHARNVRIQSDPPGKRSRTSAWLDRARGPRVFDAYGVKRNGGHSRLRFEREVESVRLEIGGAHTLEAS